MKFKYYFWNVELWTMPPCLYKNEGGTMMTRREIVSQLWQFWFSFLWPLFPPSGTIAKGYCISCYCRAEVIEVTETHLVCFIEKYLLSLARWLTGKANMLCFAHQCSRICITTWLHSCDRKGTSLLFLAINVRIL